MHFGHFWLQFAQLFKGFFGFLGSSLRQGNLAFFGVLLTLLVFAT